MDYRNDSKVTRRQLHYSPNLISTLRNSIESRNLLEITYESLEKGETRRTVEPLDIIYKHRKRNLVAFCTLRNDYRCFRLDRLNTVKYLTANFAIRDDYDVEDFKDEQIQEQSYSDRSHSKKAEEEKEQEQEQESERVVELTD